MQQTDFSFANDVRAAVELRTPKTARMLLLTGVGLMATFVIWAHFAVLDEVKRGNGRVIPAAPVGEIQPRDVHPGRDQPADHFRRMARGSEGGNDFRSAQ